MILVVIVSGRLFAPDGRRWDAYGGYWAEQHAQWSIRTRSRARCADMAACRAYVEAKRARQKLRGSMPADAVLRELHPAQGGSCKWCGETIYRRDKTGRIVPARQRMWHDGRTVDPRAEPEPRCVQEYNAQGFTFRDQVFRRDSGVCAGCGRDVEAERVAWEAERRAFQDELYRSDRRDYYQAFMAWGREHPEPRWHADHVVPLEDDGEHLLANAQTLCERCHSAKTAWENAGRAARRRGAMPGAQERLEL